MIETITRCVIKRNSHKYRNSLVWSPGDDHSESDGSDQEDLILDGRKTILPGSHASVILGYGEDVPDDSLLYRANFGTFEFYRNRWTFYFQKFHTNLFCNFLVSFYGNFTEYSPEIIHIFLIKIVGER